MSTDTRNQHYIPQAYLRAFTEGEAKKSRLTVFDLSSGQRFETGTRNVGAVRDFNRVSIPGVDANVIESGIGKFESLIKPAVAEINSSNKFEGDAKDTILNLMALLATRHPDIREQVRKFHAEIAQITVGITLAQPGMYERNIARMRDAGELAGSGPSYAEFKSFFDGGEYDIEVPNERHLHYENIMTDAALQALARRNWMLYRTSPAVAHFITSDRPVSITWQNPSKIPLMHRDSPGFGMRNTEVVFPLTKSLTLVGIFDGETGYRNANLYYVAGRNSRTANLCSKQIYSSKRSFPALNTQAQIVDGASLLRSYSKNN